MSIEIESEYIRDARVSDRHEMFIGWDPGPIEDADGKGIHTMTTTYTGPPLPTYLETVTMAHTGTPSPVHLEITSHNSIVFEDDFEDLIGAQNFFAWWCCQHDRLPQGAGMTRKAGAVDQWRLNNPLPSQALTAEQAELVAARLGKKVAA